MGTAQDVADPFDGTGGSGRRYLLRAHPFDSKTGTAPSSILYPWQRLV